MSYELPLVKNHDIVLNGYNLGRDYLVGNATQRAFMDPNDFSTYALKEADYSSPVVVPLSQSYNLKGVTRASGYTYTTTAEYWTGLLGITSTGVNHNETVREGRREALDGLVAVLTVNVTDGSTSNGCVEVLHLDLDFPANS